MNKKQYTIPEMEILLVDTADIIATSLPLYDDEANPNVGAGARWGEDLEW